MSELTIGLIPARGGSKRVPGKNIRNLCGKPLIAYTIEAALESQRLDRVIVTTDNQEIAAIARERGAEVPFIRPDKLAGDSVGDSPVIEHAVQWLRKNESQSVNAVVWLRPTTPFKTAIMIDEAIERLNTSGADSVRSVTRVDGVHHPYWMFERDDANRIRPVVPGVSIGQYYQRQLLPPVFRLNGVVDVMRNPAGIQPKLYGNDMRLLEIPERDALDIDTEIDFKWCEFLMTNREIKQ